MFSCFYNFHCDVTSSSHFLRHCSRYSKFQMATLMSTIDINYCSLIKTCLVHVDLMKRSPLPYELEDVRKLLSKNVEKPIMFGFLLASNDTSTRLLMLTRSCLFTFSFIKLVVCHCLIFQFHVLWVIFHLINFNIFNSYPRYPLNIWHLATVSFYLVICLAFNVKVSSV